MKPPAHAMTSKMPSLEAIRSERARRERVRVREELELHFWKFVRASWHVGEPTKSLVWGWPLEVVCNHAQALVEDWMRAMLAQQQDAKTGEVGILPAQSTAPLPEDEDEREAEVRRRHHVAGLWREARRLGVLADEKTGRIGVRDAETGEVKPPVQRFRKLLVNIPPGYAKSRILSVMLPAWAWLRWPSLGVFALSGNPDVALRDAEKCRELVKSAWYTSTFQPWWEFSGTTDAKGRYATSAGGWRLSKGWKAAAVGDRGDLQILDDPNDPREAGSTAANESVNTTWDDTLASRVNDVAFSVRVGVQQRVGVKDWSGHVLGKEKDWEHLKIQQRRTEFNACTCDTCKRGETVLRWKDPRAPGELALPQRFPESYVEKEEESLLRWAAQHQQEPLASEGNMFRKGNWRFWRYDDEAEPPEELADRCITIPRPERWTALGWEVSDACISADMTFKKTKNGSKVCIGAWVRQGRKRLMLDVRWGRMSYTESRRALRELAEAYPWIGPKLIEEKANGAAIIDDLATGGDGQVEVEGLIPVEPDGGKEARAHSISHLQEAGDVYLPLWPRWTQEAIAEAGVFPKQGEPNDFVDQMSQALRRLRAEEFAFV